MFLRIKIETLFFFLLLLLAYSTVYNKLDQIQYIYDCHAATYSTTLPSIFPYPILFSSFFTSRFFPFFPLLLPLPLLPASSFSDAAAGCSLPFVRLEIPFSFAIYTRVVMMPLCSFLPFLFLSFFFVSLHLLRKSFQFSFNQALHLNFSSLFFFTLLNLHQYSIVVDSSYVYTDFTV